LTLVNQRGSHRVKILEVSVDYPVTEGKHQTRTKQLNLQEPNTGKRNSKPN